MPWCRLLLLAQPDRGNEGTIPMLVTLENSETPFLAFSEGGNAHKLGPTADRRDHSIYVNSPVHRSRALVCEGARLGHERAE